MTNKKPESMLSINGKVINIGSSAIGKKRVKAISKTKNRVIMSDKFSNSELKDILAKALSDMLNTTDNSSQLNAHVRTVTAELTKDQPDPDVIKENIGILEKIGIAKEMVNIVNDVKGLFGI